MKLTTRDVARIRELRYRDGLTQVEVARRIGCCYKTVAVYAPGVPWRVDNAKLRAAFERSGRTASEVARHMGWWCANGSGSGWADVSRVRRTLGLLHDVSSRTGRRSTRQLIDAETAALMAEAIGVMPWEVMPGDDTEAA